MPRHLQILKRQLGALAEDAAALISRGDTLVYSLHARSPLLADFVQARVQDRLRAEWAGVLAEIESRRDAAVRAEDQLAELRRLLDVLRDWPPALSDAQLLEREAQVERVQELRAELRAQRVALPERAVDDVCTAWARHAERADANVRQVSSSAWPAPAVSSVLRATSFTLTVCRFEDGTEEACAEYVARANRLRSAAAALRTVLRRPPLGGKDFDEFPLQEDALQVRPAVQSATDARRRPTDDRVFIRREWTRPRRNWRRACSRRSAISRGWSEWAERAPDPVRAVCATACATRSQRCTTLTPPAAPGTTSSCSLGRRLLTHINPCNEPE